MAIDLLKVQPHKVSRDLSGYIIYIYGAPKVGKTTFASRADKGLILASEKGYSALDGILAQDINSWADIRAVLRDLRRPEVKAAYNVVALDTIDLVAKYCEKYVCGDAGVDDLGDIPYGKGFKKMREEFEDVFSQMTKLGYAVIFISHDAMRTVTRDDGTSYNDIRPSLAPDKVNDIVANMADIYGYAHLKATDDSGHKQVVLTLRDDTGMIACGCRFKYIEPEIPFTYEALTKAVNDAIDKQAQVGNAELFTDEPQVKTAEVTYDFKAMMEEFSALVKKLQADHADDFKTAWAPKIVAITDKVLGKGKKVNELVESQAEQLAVILGELKAIM